MILLVVTSVTKIRNRSDKNNKQITIVIKKKSYVGKCRGGDCRVRKEKVSRIYLLLFRTDLVFSDGFHLLRRGNGKDEFVTRL